MFKKLISNLPFSPSLAGQLGFYVHRLKQEELTRRAGLVLTALAVVVQGFIVFAPAETQASSSNNDIIYGGFTSKADLLRIYDKGKDSAGRSDIKQIYAYFGVTRADIEDTHLDRINSKDFNSGIYSTGRFAYNKKGSDEQAKKITGTNTTIYMRKLRSFDAGHQIQTGNGYAALVGKRKVDGQWFAIVLACGNVDFTKLPPAPKPAPAPKSIKVCRLSDKQIVTIKEDDYDSKKYSKDLNDCKVTPPAPTPVVTMIQVCRLSDKQIVTIKATDFNAAIYSKNLNDCAVTPTPTPTPTPTQPVCPYTSTLLKNSPDCKPCEGNSSIWYKDDHCTPGFTTTKNVANLTTATNTANGTTANSGDRLEYTLTVMNTGTASGTYTVTDTVSDVLEYADVVDNGGGTLGTLSADASSNTDPDSISWPTVTLAPGASAVKKFVVQVKSQIPATPTNPSNPESYNCEITNSFGQTTTVMINCPAPKVVEQVTTDLPSTGPTEDLLVAGGALAVVAFFYARSRQLGREVRLIRRDVNAGTI